MISPCFLFGKSRLTVCREIVFCFIDKYFQQAPLSREVARRYAVTVGTEKEAPIKQASFFIKCEFWQASL